MGIPEKLVAVDTQDTGRRQTKQTTKYRKLKQMNNVNVALPLKLRTHNLSGNRH
jgi:hypothetical protein